MTDYTPLNDELFVHESPDADVYQTDADIDPIAKLRMRLDMTYADLSEMQNLLYKLETEYSVLSYENAELKAKLKACEENKQCYIGLYERLQAQLKNSYIPGWQVQACYRRRNWLDDVLTILTMGKW